MSPALLYIFLYYQCYTNIMCVRRTTTCHKPTRRHTHTHTCTQGISRTHVINYVIVVLYICVCMCVLILYYTAACVPAGLSGNYLFTQIDHNYGYYRGDGRRGHLTPSNPARRRRQIKSARARLHTHAHTHAARIHSP